MVAEVVTLADLQGQVSGINVRVGVIAEALEALRQEDRAERAADRAMLVEIRDRVIGINGRVHRAEDRIEVFNGAWTQALTDHRDLWEAINKLRQTTSEAKARMGVWGTLLIPPITAALTWFTINRLG